MTYCSQQNTDLIPLFHSCYVHGGRLLQVKQQRKDKYRTATGWPPNTGNRVWMSEKSEI